MTSVTNKALLYEMGIIWVSLLHPLTPKLFQVFSIHQIAPSLPFLVKSVISN